MDNCIIVHGVEYCKKVVEQPSFPSAGQAFTFILFCLIIAQIIIWLIPRTKQNHFDNFANEFAERARKTSLGGGRLSMLTRALVSTNARLLQTLPEGQNAMQGGFEVKEWITLSNGLKIIVELSLSQNNNIEESK